MKRGTHSPVRLLSVRRAITLVAISVAAVGCTVKRHSTEGPGPTGERRLTLDTTASPSGLAICYGPFRAGQAPKGPQPSREEILEDLRIIESHWNALRTYSALGTTPVILELIREHNLDIRVVVGVWIDSEIIRDAQGVIIEQRADAVRTNLEEVRSAIRLANTYPEIVAAVAVGNETQVSWTGHPVETTTLIEHIREVRTSVEAPVTTADDFAFWISPESGRVAAEVDFIITHAYAMWNGTQLEEAIAFTDEKVRAVRQAHPDKLVVLGETGWATFVHTEGEQARLIKGKPGEREQEAFYESIRQWARRERVVVFFFEAFDEPWKGGSHPDEVEKHWGLFNADRTPKRAVLAGP